MATGERVADILANNARIHGDRPAIVGDSAELSFADYADRALRLADALTAAGVRRAGRVALLAENSPDFLVICAACERAGFIAAPVNYRLAAPEIMHIVAELAPAALFYDAAYADIVDALRSADPGACRFVAIDEPGHGGGGLAAMIASGRATAAAGAVSDDDIALIVHTSGTTGRPRGAMLSQRMLYKAARMIADDGGLHAADRGLIVQPLFHVGGRFLQLAHHLAGAAIRLHRGFDPAAVWADLASGAITTAQLAPTMIDMLLAARPAALPERLALRALYYSTAPIDEALLRAGLEVFGPVFIQHYGATESGVVTTLAAGDHRADGSEAQQQRLRSAGRPPPGVALRIVDDAGNPLPAGERGEIEVQHPAVMSGYWQDQAASSAAFHGPWLRMGDIGYLDDDGYLYIVDRKKDLIISGGENIYPREVENALLDHPAVAECAVFGIPDARWGESVCAAVVRVPGSAIGEEALIAHCRTLIASYKKPRRVDFHQRLPRMATGKIDKVGLRAPYWAGRARDV